MSQKSNYLNNEKKQSGSSTENREKKIFETKKIESVSKVKTLAKNNDKDHWLARIVKGANNEMLSLPKFYSKTNHDGGFDRR